MSQVMEQLSPVVEETLEPRGGTSLLFVRSTTGTVVAEALTSVTAAGSPADLNTIARSIVVEFGDALDRLAE